MATFIAGEDIEQGDVLFYDYKLRLVFKARKPKWHERVLRKKFYRLGVALEPAKKGGLVKLAQSMYDTIAFIALSHQEKIRKG